MRREDNELFYRDGDIETESRLFLEVGITGEEVEKRTELCGSMFSGKSGLTRHTRKYHNTTVDENNPCDEREKVSIRENKKYLHDEMHKEEGVLCDECGKTFKCKDNLTEHDDIHIEEGVKCDECGKTFKFKGNLTEHDDIHKEGVICDECGRTFKCKGNLMEHIREYHKAGDKSSPCNSLEKVFKTRTNLTYKMKRIKFLEKRKSRQEH